MEAKADAVPLDPTGAAPALGDNLVFLEELLCRLVKALFRLQQAGTILSTQREIPVFGNVLG